MLIKYRVYFTLSAALLKSVMTRVFSFRQTFSCRLLQRMTRMDIETWKWWEFWSFKPMHGKMTKKVITQVIPAVIEKRSRYVTLPWYQNFWMTINRKTSHKTASDFIDLVQFQLICQMSAKFSGVKSERTVFKLENEIVLCSPSL